ncbi:MAG: MraY family glycosyltransferase [Acidimicrobiales bacterium]
MRPDLSSYVVVMIVAFAVTVMTVPLFRVLAVARGLVVEPDERRAHERPTATLGGGAMFLGFAAGFGLAWYSGWFPGLFGNSTEPFGVLAAATLAYVVGVTDDIREISAPAKTAGLVLVGTLLVLGGTNIFWFRVPFLDLFLLAPDFSYLLTVIWVLGMANAVNFIDGLDGLAAGIMGIGAIAFFLYSLELGAAGVLSPQSLGPLIAALVFGICAGFLPWNAHPAKIFMGDGGSLLLGCLMAASTVAVGGRTEEAFSGQAFFFYAPLLIPLVILGVPMVDTAFAIIRRASRRQGIATADRDHLHHRLIRLGHGHRRSVLILWAWTALLSAIVLWPVYNEGEGDAVVPIGVIGMAILLFVSLHPGFTSSDDAELFDDPPLPSKPSASAADQGMNPAVVPFAARRARSASDADGADADAMTTRRSEIHDPRAG